MPIPASATETNTRVVTGPWDSPQVGLGATRPVRSPRRGMPLPLTSCAPARTLDAGYSTGALVGQLFGGVVALPGFGADSYLEFLTPAWWP